MRIAFKSPMASRNFSCKPGCRVVFWAFPWCNHGVINGELLQNFFKYSTLAICAVSYGYGGVSRQSLMFLLSLDGILWEKYTEASYRQWIAWRYWQNMEIIQRSYWRSCSSSWTGQSFNLVPVLICKICESGSMCIFSSFITVLCLEKVV